MHVRCLVTKEARYSVKLQITGTSLSMYTDGTLQLSGTDTSFAAGQIGLLCDNM
jgi:hypothetical protein